MLDEGCLPNTLFAKVKAANGKLLLGQIVIQTCPQLFTMDIKQLIKETKYAMNGLAVFGCNDAYHLEAMRIYVILFVS